MSSTPAESYNYDPQDDMPVEDKTPVAELPYAEEPPILEDYIIEGPLMSFQGGGSVYLTIEEADARPLQAVTRRKRRMVRYTNEEQKIMRYWVDNIEYPQKPRELGAQIGDNQTNSVKSKVTKFLNKLSEDPMFGVLLKSSGQSAYKVYQLGQRPEVPPSEQDTRRTKKKLVKEILGHTLEGESLPELGFSGLEFAMLDGRPALRHKDELLDIRGETLRIFTDVASTPLGIFFDDLRRKFNQQSKTQIHPLRLSEHLSYIQEILAEHEISGWSDHQVQIDRKIGRMIRFDTRADVPNRCQ